MGNKKNTAWQHYVPRMYLKNFGSIIKKKKTTIALVSFYQFDKDVLRENVPTDSICADDYFYDDDNRIEKYLSNLESGWAYWLDNIANGSINLSLPLNPDLINEMKSFAVYQYLRTNGELNKARKTATELINELNFQRNSQTSDSDVKQKVEELVNPADQVLMAQGLVNEIDDLTVKVIYNSTVEPFITSDAPVVVLNPITLDRRSGFGMIGLVMMFPVSDRYLVLVYDGKIYHNVASEITDVSEIQNINGYQVIAADERIIARSRYKLEEYKNDADLINSRNKCRSERSTTDATAYDGSGMIINVRFGNIPYMVHLKMLTLPQVFKKIPIESRETFPRKYDKKYRDALFSTVQCIRAIYKQTIGNNKTNYDRKRIEKGYKALLDFYDDYWDVPEKERTKPVASPGSKVKGTFYKINHE